MSKNLLLLAPKVANIYIEIITELEKQGYVVDYYEYKSYKLDPHYLKGYVKYGKMFTNGRISSYIIKHDWENLLSSNPYTKTYDYLLVIDGYSLHPNLFDILRKRNPKLKTVNYLFDTCRSNYEFNVQFTFFDKVVTFDIGDSRKYGIELLPIYWSPYENLCGTDIDLFGMGSYMKDRFLLFKRLADFSDVNHLKSFIRIYANKPSNMLRYRIKRMIVELLSKRTVMIPSDVFSSSIITDKFLSIAEYKKMIQRSKVVIDSNAPHQDGLTARFMWALGAEKKIVTTNKAVREYNFYTPNQIFVVNDIDSFADSEAFKSFMASNFVMPDDNRSIIEKYRIDNWLKFLLS